MSKRHKTLLDAIHAHAVIDIDSGCWNWKGAVQNKAGDPVPVLNWRGSVNSVRRLILLERFTAELGNLLKGRKKVATYSCGNPSCVNPDHTILSSRKSVQKRTAQAQTWRFDPMLQRKRSEFAREKFGKLDEAKAEAIRLDTRAQSQIAIDYGVSQATVSSIKRGRTWKTYDNTNPFRGLMK